MSTRSHRNRPHAAAVTENREFPDAAHRPSSRDLPSLDGLRAVSCGLVILGHATHGSVPPLLEIIIARLANLGVCIFFAISGYLITTLLCREAIEHGKVRLLRFYFRRTLRIFPPYYTYLAVIAIGVNVNGWPIPADARWWSALTYTSNIFSTNYWLTGHSWSLSIEEQFYLSWPVVIAISIRNVGVKAGGHRATIFAFAGLLFFPLLRAIVYSLTRDGVATAGLMFDYVAAGSAIAMLESQRSLKRAGRVLSVLVRSPYTPILGLLAIAMHLYFAGSMHWIFAIDMLFIMPIEALLLALFVAWCVHNPTRAAGRVLNVRSLRIVGVGSYSLYLWQQLFFEQSAPIARHWGAPLKLLGAILCATASYFAVERTALSLRARIERTSFESAT